MFTQLNKRWETTRFCYKDPQYINKMVVALGGSVVSATNEPIINVDADGTPSISATVDILPGTITNEDLADMTQGAVKVGGASDLVEDLGPGAEGTVLTGHGAGQTPTWELPLPQGNIEVKNGDVFALTKGTLVRVTSATVAGIPVVSAVAAANGNFVTHVITSDLINPGLSGNASLGGLVEGLDTSAYATGTQLYLDTASLGGWTDDPEPFTGSDVYQFVGAVVSQDVTNGSVLFSIRSPDTYGSYNIDDDSVTTNILQDGAATLAKLDDTGAAGQVLTANGPGVDPSWEYPNPEGTIPIYNDTGSTLTAGSLVYLSGYNTGADKLTVDLADNTQRLATHVVTADILNATSGDVAPSALVGSLNTSLAGLVGQAVYLSTSGGWTLSAPSLPYENVQQVGTVKTISMAAGEIEFFPGSSELVTIGRYMLQNDVISASQIQNYNISRYKLDSNIAGASSELATQSSGGDFPSGTLLRVTGTSGGSLAVDKVNAGSGEVATHVCYGTMFNNVQAEIFPVIQIGTLNTNAWTAGTKLYSDPTTPGAYTSTAPSAAGQVAQEIGTVLTQDISNGYIAFYPGRMVVVRSGRSNIQDQAIDTSKMADNVVTPPKMSLTVAAYLGNPVLDDDDRIVTSTDVVNSTYSIAAQPDCPRNCTVTIAEVVPSIVSGTITIVGTGADGAINVTDTIDISGGAGVYEGTKIFSYITSITGSGITVLLGAGNETIKVGVGGRIGLPSNIQNNVAVKVVFLGGAIPATASYYNGTNTSAVKNTDGGNPYDGMKPLIVTYNVGY